MGDIQTLAKKFKRALRNETGAKFGLEELRAFADHGALDILQKAEAEELKAAWAERRHLTSSATTGSTSDAMAAPPMSGRSRPTTPELDRSAIAALGARA